MAAGGQHSWSASFRARVCLRLLELFLGQEAVLVEVHLQELLDRVGGQLDAVEQAVLVGVDLAANLRMASLAPDLVGRQALGLRPVGRPGQGGVFLLAHLAVVVLVELVGLAQLHVDELVDRQHALAAARLGPRWRSGGLARAASAARSGGPRARSTLLSRSVSYWLNSAWNTASASARSTKPSRLVSRFWNSERARFVRSSSVGPLGTSVREGRLGDLDELLERELAVLVDVEFLERLHAVLQELGAR